MRNLLKILIFCPMLFVLPVCTNAQSNKSIKLAAVTNDDGWKGMTLREKIGQIMLMLPDSKKELELGNGSLAGFFKKYPVTGFFMGWKLFDGIAQTAYANQMKKSVLEYQKASKWPLIFQEDYETGVTLPGMTTFPSEMAVGAANSSELAYDYGSSVALQSRSVGVQWVLHPVADLNINPLNPITNIRSISDDPDKAIRLLSQQIKGLQQHGVAATIKHFPGDGVDFRDQHLTTTTNSLSLTEWKRYHGKVFKALIDSGVACIMPGHINLPAYQKVKLNGFYPPATLSKELLTNLLKKEMGFKGVIVSDAMVMGGFRGWYPNQLEGEIQSFIAGVDVLLWPSYQFMDTLEVRINRGEIDSKRLDDAVSRVWAMKKRFGILVENRELLHELTAEEKSFAKTTADNLCAGAVTLIRDRNHAIPLTTDRVKKILVVGVTPISRKGDGQGLEQLKNFQKVLQRKGFEVDFQHNILYETDGWEETVTKRYDKIIFVIDRHPHAPFGPLQLFDDEAQTAWAINAMPKEKLIVISFGSPYVINEYFERVNTCINAYSNNPEMHEAVVKALMGEIGFNGKTPVNLSRKVLFHPRNNH